MTIPNNFYQVLLNAGLPVLSANDNGGVVWSRELTEAENLILADILNPPTNDQLREREYDKIGATDRARLDALWEMIVENRPQAAQALQVKRLEVKAKFPKPLR